MATVIVVAAAAVVVIIVIIIIIIIIIIVFFQGNYQTVTSSCGQPLYILTIMSNRAIAY
jgi:hypothetical protein